MQYCYTRQSDAHLDNCIETGTKEVSVESYKIMIVILDILTRPETVTFVNVVYVPDFLTNVAVLNLFAAKKVHFDLAIPHIHS